MARLTEDHDCSTGTYAIIKMGDDDTRGARSKHFDNCEIRTHAPKPRLAIMDKPEASALDQLGQVASAYSLHTYIILY
jgi:hypothetical protein